MSSYSELIKNFEGIRAYMRDFYVYGFKSREEFRARSARSYDDERRRVESWLGEYMRFVRTPEGKTVFLSIDSRSITHNPLYNAWKAKSFTDGDITLHFILMDILHAPCVRRTVGELVEEIDENYLSGFPSPMTFDESTVRKKLKEYCEEGLLLAEREGRRVYYRRADSPDIRPLSEALAYFSEVAPCGVIGSFLLDKVGMAEAAPFGFKHHYITGAIDADVLASLLAAMQEERIVTADYLGRGREGARRYRLLPLRILISVQGGRQHLAAYLPEDGSFRAFRIDRLSAVTWEEREPRFAELRAAFCRMQAHSWGVVLPRGEKTATEHVEFTVRIERGEQHILRRLKREGRMGRVERLDSRTYRFSAEVYDSSEMIPWIRSFLCRILQMNFSNRTVENRFKQDVAAMYRTYGLGEGG